MFMSNVNDVWDIDDEEFDDLDVDTQGVQEPEEVNNDDIDNDIDNDDEDINDDEQEPSDVDGFIAELLKAKGFNDASKIPVINEDGEEEIVSFNDLSDEDKAAILSEQTEEYHPAELEAINFMRENKMTLKDIADYYMELGRKEALEVQNTNYTVDDYTDEELFVADLQNRFEDLTEEEIAEYIERAKTNESIFKKQCDKLRNEYKAIEDAEKEKAQNEIKEQSVAEYNQIVSDMNDVANQVESINDMILEHEDKVDILKFILDKDVEGKTPIIKAIEDPTTLYKVAWFLLKGEEANKSIVNYFTGEIEKLKASKPSTVKVKPSIDNLPKKEHKQKRAYSSITDLYD